MRTCINCLSSLIKLSWFEAAIEEVWKMPSHINIMLARRKGSVVASLWVLFLRQGDSTTQMKESQFVSDLLPIQCMSWFRGMLTHTEGGQVGWDWKYLCSSSCMCLTAGAERRGGRHALPCVEPNHYLSHEVAATSELILETVFCKMPATEV